LVKLIKTLTKKKGAHGPLGLQVYKPSPFQTSGIEVHDAGFEN
jgi:hypothetical protein